MELFLNHYWVPVQNQLQPRPDAASFLMAAASAFLLVIVLAFWHQHQQRSSHSAHAKKFPWIHRSSSSNSNTPTGKQETWWWDDPLRLLLPDTEFLVPCERSLEDDVGAQQDLLDHPETIVHFCFLIHGYRGVSRDLDYVQHVMRQASVDAETNTSTGNKQCLVVHSVLCNEKRTDDGVEAGGTRLVDEMLAVIRSKCRHAKDKVRTITVSMLGNSLGGLYARYALGQLQARCRDSCQDARKHQSGRYILDDAYELHLNMFCTTATPHLGISGHTFLPLPRRAEIPIAHAMGQSGKDLFRVSALLHTMSVDPQYLAPLAAFRKRMAYANAYGTDFPVPPSTAAFLSEYSGYPHHIMDTNEREITHDDDSDEDNKPPKSLVVATLHIPSVKESKAARDYYNSTRTSEKCSKGVAHDKDYDYSAELAEMSISLDALGWKKVFVDMRKEVPRIAIPKTIPKVLLRRHSNGQSTHEGDSSSSGDESSSNCTPLDQDSVLVEPIHRLEKGVVSSKDVAASVSVKALPDEEISLLWPSGHNMMVAVSRSRWSSYINKAGRPVVDSLAKELVQNIFAFEVPKK